MPMLKWPQAEWEVLSNLLSAGRLAVPSRQNTCAREASFRSEYGVVGHVQC